jgi:hypothetical protein
VRCREHSLDVSRDSQWYTEHQVLISSPSDVPNRYVANERLDLYRWIISASHWVKLALVLISPPIDSKACYSSNEICCNHLSGEWMSMALSELDITSWKAGIMIRVSHVPTAHQTHHGGRFAVCLYKNPCYQPIRHPCNCAS